MLISAEYRKLNHKLHDDPDYGNSGHKWADTVAQMAKDLGTQDVLDYGCGKRTLEYTLGFQIKNYDPAIPEYSDPPEPADIVVCSDVLEHIEPECLDAVLDDLQRVVNRFGLFVIATKKASKTLPDGRNAHLIVEDARFWVPKIASRFAVHQLSTLNHWIVVVVRK